MEEKPQEPAPVIPRMLQEVPRFSSGRPARIPGEDYAELAGVNEPHPATLHQAQFRRFDDDEIPVEKRSITMRTRDVPPKDLKPYAGKSVIETASYVINRFVKTKKCTLGDTGFAKYLEKHRSQAPDSFKDGRWHYFLLDAIKQGQYIGGEQPRFFPGLRWDGLEFERQLKSVDSDWEEEDGFVIIENT